MIKWVFSDVDGCLCPEESQAWDLDAMRRVAAWCRESAAGNSGLPGFTLCTGRPQPYVEVLAKLFDIRVPMICENGAVVYTLADNHARYGPGVTPEKIVGLRRLQEFLEEELLPRHPGAILQFGKMAQLSVYSENPALLRELTPPVLEYAGANALELNVEPSHYYLNISLKGVSKGSALEWLRGELGVHRGECAGIGDTEGDLALRDAVGWFACPANAQPAIKEVADYISPHPVTEGVMDILRRIEDMKNGKER